MTEPGTEVNSQERDAVQKRDVPGRLAGVERTV
jgi:hypothetical protein